MDACSIAIFQSERVRVVDGPATRAVNFILQDAVMALDCGDRIRTEWLAAASHAHSALNLADWLADRLHDGAARLYLVPNDNHLKKALRQLGLHNMDRFYVLTASAAMALVLASDDIDFYDPTLKNARHEKKERVKGNRQGVVCNWLRKNLRVEVSRLCDAPDILTAQRQ